MKYAVILYFATVWLASAVMTATDKISARRHLSRVPEKTLFLFAIIGGAVSMYATMLLIRHKTKHKSFMIGLPIIIFIHVIIIVSVAKKLGII